MDDARYLLKDYQLDCVGCVDLRNLVPRTMPSAAVYVDYCILIVTPVKRHTFVAAFLQDNPGGPRTIFVEDINLSLSLITVYCFSRFLFSYCSDFASK